MGSMDFMNMNMNTGFFSWIISADISVLLKIYGYEYEYVKFSWILSMGSPIIIARLEMALGYMIVTLKFVV
jgi:hypothetical protein